MNRGNMKELEDLRWTYLTGHVLEVLPTIPDESVDCIKTSPPYWGLRDYGEENNTVWDGDPDCEHEWGEYLPGHHPGQVPQTKVQIASGSKDSGTFCTKCNAWFGQLGLEPTLKLFIDHLLLITSELRRVLKPTGIMWWNQGDCYGGSGGAGGDYNKGGLREGQPKYPRRSTDPHPLTPAGQKVMAVPVQAKCMTLQNHRLLIRMVDEQGWICRNINIWNKPCHMPSSAKDRFTNTYEPVYFLTKSNEPIYYYHEKTMLMQDNPPPSKKVEGVDWEWQLCKHCNGTGKVDELKLQLSNDKSKRLLTKVNKKCSECKGKGKTKHSFWNGLDYWFDLESVREPYKFNRWGGRYKTNENVKTGPNEKRAGGQGPTNRMGYDCYPQSGKNPGDYIDIDLKNWMDYSFELWNDLVCDESISDIWKINTASFADTHFAVFPDKLVEKCLKAGCPKEVCIKCGKPRVRIIKRSVSGELKDRPYCGDGQLRSNQTSGGQGTQHSSLGQQHKVSREMTGWTDCGCNAGFRPGIVLDPFVGSGTVLKVARKLNRNAIGIDINPKYKAMGEREAKLNIPDIFSFDEEVEV